MLRNFDNRLNADVIRCLRAMGHGDDLVICDTNFPADSVASHTVTGDLLRMDNLTAAEAIDAILSVFPLDSFVQLSTGAIAQVIGTNPDNILRPEVLVRWDADWSPVDPPRRLDLADNPEVTVARALLEAELPIT